MILRKLKLPRSIIACLLLCRIGEQTLPAQGTLWKGGELPFMEARDLNSATRRGKATLAVETARIRVGDLLLADVLFSNTGEASSFYNPFFTTTKPLPAQLAVYDSNNKYIGNLLRNVSDSQASPRGEDWVRVPSGGSVGAKLRLRVTDLAPGEYYLQIVYFNRFAVSSVQELFEPSAVGELFRSNTIKITIDKS